MRRELKTGLTGDVPIVLSQWYDTAKWILEKIDKFPKNQRFICGSGSPGLPLFSSASHQLKLFIKRRLRHSVLV